MANIVRAKLTTGFFESGLCLHHMGERIKNTNAEKTNGDRISNKINKTFPLITIFIF